jgi:hypothetical protein
LTVAVAAQPILADGNHKGQGRIFDSAHVLVNPALVDREWAYAAASRSRFATTLYADSAALRPIDRDTHQTAAPVKERDDLISDLASRMRRSRAKGTTLDWQAAPAEAIAPSRIASLTRWAHGLSERLTKRQQEHALERTR